MKWLNLGLLLLVVIPAHARDQKQVRLFRATHICPVTNTLTTHCPGYVVDHIIPLCAGGPDHPSNMQYQELRESYIKDIQERKQCRLLKK